MHPATPDAIITAASNRKSASQLAHRLLVVHGANAPFALVSGAPIFVKTWRGQQGRTFELAGLARRPFETFTPSVASDRQRAPGGPTCCAIPMCARCCQKSRPGRWSCTEPATAPYASRPGGTWRRGLRGRGLWRWRGGSLVLGGRAGVLLEAVGEMVRGGAGRESGYQPTPA